MNIFQIVDQYGSAGGTENHVHDLSLALEQAGHRCAIAYNSQGRAGYHFAGRSEYPIMGLTSRQLALSPDVIQQLEAALTAEQPDVAYVHSYSSAASHVLSTRQTPTALFVHNHDPYCPAGSKLLQRSGRVCPHAAGPGCFVQAFLEQCQSRRPLTLVQNYVRMRRLGRWARQVEMLQVDSRDMQARLLEAGHVPARIVVLPTPVRLPPVVPERQPNHNHPLVVFAGQLTPLKGLDLLLRAVAISTTDFRLAVAGDGYQGAALRAMAQSFGIGERTDFLGWVNRSRMEALYANARVVVVPSVWPEPFGMVGPEAMGHGKPVVAFDVGGIPDWLEHGVTGYLVPPGDVATLARRIDELVSNPELAQRMGAAGRERALRLYGMDQHVRKLIAVFEQAIALRASRKG